MSESKTSITVSIGNVVIVLLLFLCCYELHQIRSLIQTSLIESPVTTSSFQEIKRIHEAERLGEISEKISKLRPGTPDTVKIRIAKAIFDIAEEQDMSVDLIIALAREESNIDPSTPPSSAGAIGMLQVMPFWAKVLPFCRDLYDLKTNVRCGTYIYSFYRGMFKSDEAALVAYNQGPRSVKRSIREGTPVGTAYSSRVIAYLTQLSTK